MREITSHKVNGLNEALTIKATDQPGPGNANHEYVIEWEIDGRDAPGAECSNEISFQNGPIEEVGVCGVSNEALLAIVEDRLKSFQTSPWVCRENAIALTHIQDAMNWLHRRTRVARGVEGTSAV